MSSAREEGRRWARSAQGEAERRRTEEQTVRKVERVQRDLVGERKATKALRREVEELERALELALAMDRPLTPAIIRPRSGRGRDQGTACVVASDWHVESRVDSDRMNGLNEYTPAIARARAERFWQGVVYLIRSHRAVTRITDLLVAAIGDFITGWIHEELRASNYLNPVDAMFHAEELLYDGLAFVRRELPDLRIRVVCKRGNHSRITDKVYTTAPERLSFEWILYRMLARRFEADPSVSFTIEPGYFSFVQVYDQTLRVAHGDFVRYGDGVGGLTIPLNKRIAKWNQARRADLDLLGHWHQLQYGGRFIVNGSLIGFDSYAESIGASPEPPQQAFFLLRPERGVAAFAPVFCR